MYGSCYAELQLNTPRVQLLGFASAPSHNNSTAPSTCLEALSSLLCPEPAAEAVPTDSNEAPGTLAGTSPLPVPAESAPTPPISGASAAIAGCRRCSKPGPAAAGAGAGPGAGDRRTWGRGINAHQLRNLMHRTCRSRFNQAERRDEPDQPKIGSNNQEDKCQDING